MSPELITSPEQGDILKSRNIPDTLLKAIVDIHTQNKISIKFSSRPSNLAEINRVREGCRLSHTLFNICEGCPFTPTLLICTWMK
jgi:hypothetical protein